MLDFVNYQKEVGKRKATVLSSVLTKNIVSELEPSNPTYLIFADTIKKNAFKFLNCFKGEVLYAVKTNPNRCVIKSLIDGGITSFDVSSLVEIELIRSISDTKELHFMNPVKKAEDIAIAYHKYQIRHFSFDHRDELQKILIATNNAKDLSLTLRFAVGGNNEAFIDLSTKFGATFNESIELLKKARPLANKLGVSFHVGTQTTNSIQYAKAIKEAKRVLDACDVRIDFLNIGGGFPVHYENYQTICSVEDCVNQINKALKKCQLSHLKILAEPGRILVANGVKLATRIELRKDNLLYINDGIYGGLFDASDWLGLQYPVQAVSVNSQLSETLEPYRLAGPTCDSIDMINTPCFLPSNVKAGDWIVFDNIGAYSQSLRSNFNGVGHADLICV